MYFGYCYAMFLNKGTLLMYWIQPKNM